MERFIKVFKNLMFFTLGFVICLHGGYGAPDLSERLARLEDLEESMNARIKALGPGAFVPPSAKTAKSLIKHSFELALEPLKVSRVEPHSSLNLDLAASQIEFANKDAKANAPYSDKEIEQLSLSLRNLMSHVEGLVKLRERLSLHLKGFSQLEALDRSQIRDENSLAAQTNLEIAVLSLVAELGGNELYIPLWMVNDDLFYKAEVKSLNSALEQYKKVTSAKGRSSEKVLELIEWVEDHNQMRGEVLVKFKSLHEKIELAEKKSKVIFKKQ
jgi:hypothetical protein